MIPGEDSFEGTIPGQCHRMLLEDQSIDLLHDPGLFGDIKGLIVLLHQLIHFSDGDSRDVVVVG